MPTYAAYGSNLDPAQMRSRCPGSLILGRGIIEDYCLTFGDWSRNWGGAVANIVPARGDAVDVVLWALTRPNLLRMDGYEGAPWKYERVRMEVVTDRGSRVQAWTYLMPPEDAGGHPSPAYVATILRGYKTFSLPACALRDALPRGWGESAKAKPSRRRRSRQLKLSDTLAAGKKSA